MNPINQNRSLEDISRMGERIYLDELKTKLESVSMGQYVVIDVESKQYEVDPDRLAAIEKAQSKFGKKIFYVVQVGMLQQPSTNFMAKRHAWNF